MKEGRHWEVVEDGYHKRSRYVQYPRGLIIGSVEGCNCDSSKPWGAFIEGPKNLLKHVGDYTTEAQAKRAVESAQPTSRDRA